MEELKLLTVPIDEYFYTKIRDQIIDKIDIKGYESSVKKGVERTSRWQDIKTPYAKRNSKLLSILHSQEEIESITKSKLDYFLKGHELSNRKVIVAGEEASEGGSIWDWIKDFINDVLDLVGDILGIDINVDFSNGFDFNVQGDDWDFSIGYDEDGGVFYVEGHYRSGQNRPDQPSNNQDQDDGEYDGYSSQRSLPIPQISTVFSLPYDLPVVKSLNFSVMEDKSMDEIEAIHEIMTDYLLLKFEAEGRLSLVEDKIKGIKSDTKLQINAGYEALFQILDFLNSQKSTFEKQLFVFNNNMAYYQQKLEGLHHHG